MYRLVKGWVRGGWDGQAFKQKIHTQFLNRSWTIKFVNDLEIFGSQSDWNKMQNIVNEFKSLCFFFVF